MKNQKPKILQEFIDLILEQEQGVNDLYNTFIQPFVDVGQTVNYGIEKLSKQVQTVLKGLAFGIPTLFWPFLEYDYSTFREQEKDKLDKLRQKYEKTLQANLEAIFTNDAFGLAFLLNPIATLATQLTIRAPDTAWRALHGLAGSSWNSSYNGNRHSFSRIGFHDPGHHERGAWSSSGGSNTGYGDMGGPGNTFELEEETTPTNNDTQHTTQDVMNLLKNKEFINKLNQSPTIKQMKQDGVNVLIDHIKEFLSLNDYNQMRQHAKNDVGFNAIGQQISQLNQSGQIPTENNEIVTNALVPEIKKTYKDFWIKQMQQMIQKYPSSQNELLNGIKTIENIKL